MSKNNEHDIKAALGFLKNLKEELILSQNIEELQDPTIIKKFEETILFLENILST